MRYGGSAIVLVLLFFSLLFRFIYRFFPVSFFFWMSNILIFYLFVIFFLFSCFYYFFSIFPFFLIDLSGLVVLFDFFPFFFLSWYQVSVSGNNDSLPSSFYLGLGPAGYLSLMLELASHAGVFRGARLSSLPTNECNPALGSTFYGALNWRGTLVQRGGRKGSFQHLWLSILAELQKIIIIIIMIIIIRRNVCTVFTRSNYAYWSKIANKRRPRLNAHPKERALYNAVIYTTQTINSVLQWFTIIVVSEGQKGDFEIKATLE